MTLSTIGIFSLFPLASEGDVKARQIWRSRGQLIQYSSQPVAPRSSGSICATDRKRREAENFSFLLHKVHILSIFSRICSVTLSLYYNLTFIKSNIIP